MKTSWRQTGSVTIRITKQQLAFLRGYLDGLDLAKLAQRYLATDGSAPDLRVIKSHLKSIRETVLIAAQRGGREFRDARLLLIDPEKLRSTAKAKTMSLEEFREERDPYEVYGEAELLEMYNDEFGAAAVPDRRSERNERLRRRQVRSIALLEQLLATDPSADDGVGGWLEPNIANRLTSAGIQTLGELVARINARGARWWKTVPGIGQKAAASLVQWVSSPYIASNIDRPIESHALVKPSKLNQVALLAARRKEFDIVPIEAFEPPPPFAADRSAALTWLSKFPAGTQTHRAYRKEIERLLLFCSIELKTPFPALADSHLEVYGTFLSLLGQEAPEWPFAIAAHRWIGQRDTERWRPQWRPFAGPLAPKSQVLALRACRTFRTWYLDQQNLALPTA